MPKIFIFGIWAVASLRGPFKEMNNNRIWLLTVVIAIVVGFLGYLMGDQQGYKRSQAEVKKAQEVAGQKAAEDAANAANPFKATNPLEGVETNPFEEAKKVLNPFN